MDFKKVRMKKKNKNSKVLTRGLRVFWATYSVPGDAARRSAKWYIEFQFDGKPRRVPGFTDLQQTEQLAHQIHRLAMCQESHTQIDQTLAGWIEAMSPSLRARLVRMGVLDGLRLSAHRPLSEHLLEWKQTLLAKGNTEAYAAVRCARVSSVFSGCGFTFWPDLASSGSASTIQSFLGGRRKLKRGKAGGIGGKSINYYTAAVKSFTHWMVKDNRARVDPMHHLKGVHDAESDTNHERRALCIDELTTLLKTTDAQGVERHGMSALERVLLYRFQFETGLRSKQTRSLTVSSFSFGADRASVTAAARYVKRRKAHTQILTPILAADLQETFRTKSPAALAFAMPDPYRVIKMYKADLTAARDAWIVEAPEGKLRSDRLSGDFLSYRDRHGLVADFYSLRHAHGTALANVGVPTHDIQASMHHTTVKTTQRYIHSTANAVSTALATLPNIAPDRRLAIGMDGKETEVNDFLPSSLPCQGAHNVPMLRSVAQEQYENSVQPSNEKPPENPGVSFNLAENQADSLEWAEPGLNRRHMDFQSIALPAELSAPANRK